MSWNVGAWTSRNELARTERGERTNGQLTRRETATEGEAGTSPSTSAGPGVGPPDTEEAEQVVVPRRSWQPRAAVQSPPDVASAR